MELLSTKKQRNSNVELLKIIAMLMIVFAHQVDSFSYSGVGGEIVFNLLEPTTDARFLLLDFISPLGLFGDVIFIACSAFFLIDSNRISVKKIVLLIVTEIFVMWCEIVVKASIGDAITTRQILDAVFPTILQVNWFIGYYIVFYLLHPLFNYVIRKLDKKGLAIVAAIFALQCNVILFGMGNIPGAMGAKFLCFISIYFIVAFYKLYGGRLWESKKFNVILLVASLAVYVAFRIAMNFIAFKIEYVAPRQFGYAHINNPFVVLFALAAINLATRKPRQVKIINYFSGLTLVVYLVHKHLQFASHAHYMEYFLDTYGADSFVWWLLTHTLIILGITLVLAVLYRHTVYYGVIALGAWAEKGVYALCEKLKVKRQNRKKATAQTETEDNAYIEPAENVDVNSSEVKRDEEHSVADDTLNERN